MTTPTAPCCTPAAQETCCAPEAKAECCGTPADATRDQAPSSCGSR